jgi:hypothetical protein
MVIKAMGRPVSLSATPPDLVFGQDVVAKIIHVLVEKVPFAKMKTGQGFLPRDASEHHNGVEIFIFIEMQVEFHTNLTFCV